LLQKAGAKNGMFLVRKHPKDKTQFVLGLIYKGMPTHHLIKQTEDSVYVINNKKYGEFTKMTQVRRP
jgi:hypothetical protein